MFFDKTFPTADSVFDGSESTKTTKAVNQTTAKATAALPTDGQPEQTNQTEHTRLLRIVTQWSRQLPLAMQKLPDVLSSNYPKSSSKHEPRLASQKMMVKMKVKTVCVSRRLSVISFAKNMEMN